MTEHISKTADETQSYTDISTVNDENTLAKRDASGRLKASNPAVDLDVANKEVGLIHQLVLIIQAHQHIVINSI